MDNINAAVAAARRNALADACEALDVAPEQIPADDAGCLALIRDFAANVAKHVPDGPVAARNINAAAASARHRALADACRGLGIREVQVLGGIAAKIEDMRWGSLRWVLDQCAVPHDAQKMADLPLVEAAAYAVQCVRDAAGRGETRTVVTVSTQARRNALADACEVLGIDAASLDTSDECLAAIREYALAAGARVAREEMPDGVRYVVETIEDAATRQQIAEAHILGLREACVALGICDRDLSDEWACLQAIKRHVEEQHAALLREAAATVHHVLTVAGIDHDSGHLAALPPAAAVAYAVEKIQERRDAATVVAVGRIEGADTRSDGLQSFDAGRVAVLSDVLEALGVPWVEGEHIDATLARALEQIGRLVADPDPVVNRAQGDRRRGDDAWWAEQMARARRAAAPPPAVQTFDPVQKPSHYAAGKVECIDAIEAALQGDADPVSAFLRGQVLKYVWRLHGKGAPLQDAKKAAWYLERLIGHLTAGEERPLPVNVEVEQDPHVLVSEHDNPRDIRQGVVSAWCARAFGAEHASNLEQRAVRFLEEAVEVYQAAGAGADMAHRLVDHVFSKDKGDLAQELGGAGVTLLALSAAASLSADDCERREVERVTALPEEHWRARNRAKDEAGFNVPGAASPAGLATYDVWRESDDARTAIRAASCREAAERYCGESQVAGDEDEVRVQVPGRHEVGIYRVRDGVAQLVRTAQTLRSSGDAK